MPYKIQDVSEDDFPTLIKSMWYAYEHPVQDLFYVFCPKNAANCSTKEESIQESIDRFWQWHTSDPSSHWMKAVDTETGELVGGTLWKIHDRNPFEKHEGEEAYWQPEGGQREYANKFLQEFEDCRSRLGARPQVYLNIIWTDPKHQRRGVGTQLLQWGIDKAAEMDVEMWLNASPFGRPLYEKHGFHTVLHHNINVHTDNPDEAWERCAREWSDFEEWVMWRPKDGPYVEGKSVKPWESAQ